MRNRGRLVQWGLAAAAAAMMLAPTGAHADVKKCQNKIEVEIGKLRTSIYTALQVCKDAVRTEVAKGVLTGLGTSCQPGGGGCMANAATTCEAKLKPVYDVANALGPGKSAFAKFRKDIEIARAGKCANAGNNGTACHANAQCTPVVGKVPSCTAICNDEDLAVSLSQDGSSLGHLVSGAGGYAPPATATNCDLDGDGKADPNCAAKYIEDLLMFATEKLTIQQQLMNVPDTLALFQDAVSAVPGPLNGSGIAAKKGTACGTTVNANTEQARPNLCRFGVECRDHACQIDTSGTCFDSSPCDASDTSGFCLDSSPCHTDDPAACSGHPTQCSASACSGNGCDPNNSFVQVKQPGAGLNLKVPVAGGLSLDVCKAGRTSGQCKTGLAPCQSDADCGANAPCNLNPGEGAGGVWGTEPNFLYLINEPQKTVRAIIPPGLPAVGACVLIARSEGWCDCTGGHSLPNTFSLCSDHVQTQCARHCTGGTRHPACTTNADCTNAPSAGSTCSGSKTCHDGTTACVNDSACPAVSGNDACGLPIDATNTDGTYATTIDGGTTIAASGAATAGDCVDLVSAQFTLLTDPTDLGPDGLACTFDDFAAPTAPFSLPLTTGTASATLLDAPSAGLCTHSGHCSGGAKGACDFAHGNADCTGLSSGTCNRDACVQDANCQQQANDPCTGAAFSSLLLSLSGGKSTCSLYGSSNLSGLGITGAIAANAAPLGDVSVAFKFACK